MSKGFGLNGQRILIVGANGGIGRETARICRDLGASLILSDLRAPDDLAAELSSAGAQVESQPCDIVERSQVEALVERYPDLDSVVVLSGYCPWDDWQAPDWDAAFTKVLDVNLRGVINVSRAAANSLQRGGGGRLILVGSVAGRTGGLRASPHYVAAKGGVHVLVPWLARRYAVDGILVNGVAPGATVTPMTETQSFDTGGIPLGRMAEAEEIAWPIAFLCAPAASYICGTILDVNGGVHMG